MEYDLLIKELLIRKDKVYDYLNSSRFRQAFSPKHIHDSVYSYLRYGGKALRPSVLLFACGAVGGDESKMIPAASAVEIFHTWTIVHDDIIDPLFMRNFGKGQLRNLDITKLMPSITELPLLSLQAICNRAGLCLCCQNSH
jgi:hypothetical protein